MAANKQGYNTTQLNPGDNFEKHVYHRDMFAHYFRWSHVLKNAKIGQKILDFGCGSGEMLELFYRNKFRPAKYVGLDIREKTIADNNERFGKLDFAEFHAMDLCKEVDLEESFDIITCFEVIEHIGHKNADAFLENIWAHCNDNTVVYLSTPNYDPKVGAAENHILANGEIGEWLHSELQEQLEKYFDVVAKHGTFASMKDYKDEVTDGSWKQQAFEALKDYYDTNFVSVIMAPLVSPEKCRNCLWVLKAKADEEEA